MLPGHPEWPCTLPLSHPNLSPNNLLSRFSNAQNFLTVKLNIHPFQLLSPPPKSRDRTRTKETKGIGLPQRCTNENYSFLRPPLRRTLDDLIEEFFSVRWVDHTWKNSRSIYESFPSFYRPVIFDSLSRIYGSEGNNFAKMFLGRAVPEINFSLSPPS